MLARPEGALAESSPSASFEANPTWLWRVERVLGSLLAVLVGDVLRVRRRHVVDQMTRAGIADAPRRARDMYRSLGVGVIELLVSTMGRARLTRVTLPEATLGELTGGAVVATAHTGNWDLVACALAERRPLAVVTKRFSIHWLNEWWQGARRRRGVRLLEAGQVVRGVSTSLRRGRLVAMMIDQAPERARAVTKVDFLGQPAMVDLAPALLAARAGVPLVVAFPRRRAAGHHDVVVREIIPPETAAARDWAVKAMHTATRHLEAFVRDNPDQWLWMHRRWKGVEPSLQVGARAGVLPSAERV